jgi:hypothetical protein
MKKSRLNVLFTTLLGCIVLMATGCGIQQISSPDEDKTTPADVCTGDACTQTGDAKEDLEVIIPTDGPETDKKEPEVKQCETCKAGDILCDGETSYFVCGDDGCWAAQSTSCGKQSTCVCLDKGGECGPQPGDECVCEPDCDGKECGPDGCGGSCGACEEGFNCNELSFKCIEVDCDFCESFCQEGDMECNGEEVSHCIDVNAGKLGCVECWLFDDISEPCPGGQTCDSDASACVCGGGVAACGDECCATVDYVCNAANECCEPQCDGKDCGSDNCGGSCGTCVEGEFCNASACQTECLDDCDEENELKCAVEGGDFFEKCEKVCDDCGKGGGICLKKGDPVYCEENEECKQGECVCVPDCDGKICGSDGCEGSCGECEGDFIKCNADGTLCGCDCEGEPTGTMCDLATETEYASNCLGTCAGATDLQKGPCPTCQDDCTEQELNPMDICASDMATYPNFCELKCQIGGPDCTALNNCPQVKYPGACKPDCCEDQGCSSDFNPLCGTNGVTYCNKCALQICGGDDGADVSCVGQCLDPVACPDCADECEPVCGIHLGAKKNYGSTCMMECEAAELLWDGECCLHCDEFEQWVCAADGDSYKAHINDCFQNCQAPEQISLYEIPLLPNGDVWFDLCEDCQCDISTPEPVCGDDFFTYANQCALECAAASNPDNPPVGNVPYCPGECFSDECGCPEETKGLPVAGQIGGGGIRGVCGADGNTYGNECHAAQFGTFVVSESWCGSCAPLCGQDEYLPVCCAGVTYPNACIADKCNDEINPAEVCFKGKCCAENADCDDDNADTVDTCNNGVCENI